MKGWQRCQMRRFHLVWQNCCRNVNMFANICLSYLRWNFKRRKVPAQIVAFPKLKQHTTTSKIACITRVISPKVQTGQVLGTSNLIFKTLKEMSTVYRSKGSHLFETQTLPGASGGFFTGLTSKGTCTAEHPKNFKQHRSWGNHPKSQSGTTNHFF